MGLGAPLQDFWANLGDLKNLAQKGGGRAPPPLDPHLFLKFCSCQCNNTIMIGLYYKLYNHTNHDRPAYTERNKISESRNGMIGLQQLL